MPGPPAQEPAWVNARSPMSFQVQPLQHVYPPQVQYVEGGDAVYTNGALYVGLPSPRRQAWATSRTFPHDSPHLFPFGPVCAGTSPPPLGDVGPGTTVLGQESPAETSEITGLPGSHFQKRQAFHKTKQNTPQSSLLSPKIPCSQSRHHCPLHLLIRAWVHLWLFAMLIKLDFLFVKDF